MNLSICIPTYNRPDFLAWTIDKLEALFGRRTEFPQIVVSNDASTRGYGTLPQEPIIRWIHQPANLGHIDNLLFVLKQATRKYAVYCADDDYLLPSKLAAAINYMDDHPECSALCAPTDLYDEVNDKSFGYSFACEERSYTLADGVDLFNFIISNHVWPEVMLYRTPVPMPPRTRAYWCYTELLDLLAHGSIHFSPTPFYRALLMHPLGDHAMEGNAQALTFFDQYRAGLEVLAYGLFGEQPYAARRQIQDMIASFMCSRMDKASQLYAKAGNMAEAMMLRKRLVIADPRPDRAAEAVA